MARVFISHASKDAEEASRLLEWLKAQGFDGVFLDLDQYSGIPPGTDWERTLYREIARAEAVLLVLTANWFSSKWCFVEFTQARALGKAIFPLVASPAGDTFVAGDIQHLDLRKDREGGLARLSAELTRIALGARGEFSWDRTRSPFPGLLAYEEEDAAIYFGRDDDVRHVIERLNARRAQGGTKLVALLGASGSGKSSLMRAGVLPRLKRDKRNWIVLPPFRPQIHPLDELAQTFAQALGPNGNWRDVREGLLAHTPNRFLSDLSRDLRAAKGSNDARILISIDQGEELFGTADHTEAQAFWTVLNAMLGEHSSFIILLGMRSDHLGMLQQAPGLKAPFESFSLKPLPLERVREIIEGPARIGGLRVENDLVTAAIKDASTDDALPLLAFALRRLYDRNASSGSLTVDAYRALGSEAEKLSPLENAVRQRADEVLAEAKPTPEELEALKYSFVPALVRVSMDGEYVRRPAPVDSLPPRARPLIERLVNARLLVKRQEGTASIVEVAHEALLRKWPLLRKWLDEERGFLTGKQQLEQDLCDWQGAGETQRAGALLSGLKLARAKPWLIERPNQLSDAERSFVAASVENETHLARKSSRQKGLAFSSLAVLGLIAALGGPWAYSVVNEQRVIDREAARTDIRGQILALAVVGGGTALDTAPGSQTSPYTTPLVVKLRQEAKSLIEALQDVNIEALRLTQQKQRPLLSTSMDGNLYLWKQPPSRSKRAVVVSVSDAGGGISVLSAPRHDGDAFAAVLHDAKFKDDEIMRLHDVSRAEIESAVTRACQAFGAGSGGAEAGLPKADTEEAWPNTLLIFYFSGHGFSVEYRDYLLPKLGNRQITNAEAALSLGLPLDPLKEKLSTCAAASVLILDTHFPRVFDTPAPLR